MITAEILASDGSVVRGHRGYVDGGARDEIVIEVEQKVEGASILSKATISTDDFRSFVEAMGRLVL